jgi:hypothetical protein
MLQFCIVALTLLGGDTKGFWHISKVTRQLITRNSTGNDEIWLAEMSNFSSLNTATSEIGKKKKVIIILIGL